MPPNTSLDVDFATLFQEVLAQFDNQPEGFALARVQDELAGQMARLLALDYDALRFEIEDAEGWNAIPAPAAQLPTQPKANARPGTGKPHAEADEDIDVLEDADDTTPASDVPSGGSESFGQPGTSVPTTKRLTAINEMLDRQLGDDPEQNEWLATAWHIDPALNAPENLRPAIAQLAQEIAAEAGVADYLRRTEDGIGFHCDNPSADDLPTFARAVLALLSALSSASAPPIENWSSVLLGPRSQARPRLSDPSLVKLFRLLRLARRLLDLLDPPSESIEIQGS